MIRRVVRYADARGAPRLGLLGDDAVVQPVVGDLFGELVADGAPVPQANLRLLAPVVPSKVIGIGSNYRDHAREMGREVPEVPKLFLKPSTSVIGPGEAITIPPRTERVDHEAELGVVIGRVARAVSREQAMDVVLGFVVVNDVTARDFQKADGQFTRAKGFDTFCPLGPCIAMGLDPADLAVQAWVDGELRQDGRTRDLVFDVPSLVAFVSGVMTLLPGDVIATGTPAGVGPILAGQRVRVAVEGIGVLENPVIHRADRAG